MSHLFRSAGLAPVAGTIDWLTRARREKRFSAGLVPVESTIHSTHRDERFRHALDRDKPGTGRGIPPGSSFSLAIIARRGQAPDVAEQNQHQGTLIGKPDFAHARPTSPTLRLQSPAING
jgi:hypothetical protein